MKSCPTCNRTYPDDTLAFCLMDGSVLSAPYDPSQTRATPPRSNEPPPTEVISAPAKPAEPRPPLQSTIRAPVPQVPDLHAAKTPATLSASEERIAVPLIFRLALAARGILAAVCIIPSILGRSWWSERPWKTHVLFAGVLTLTAGVSMFLKSRKGILLILDATICLIVAAAYFISSQWSYWDGTWPLVSGALLMAAAFELRKHVSRAWLLALAGLIFGFYSLAFFVWLAVPLTYRFTYRFFYPFWYVKGASAFFYGVTLTAFALLTRPPNRSDLN